MTTPALHVTVRHHDVAALALARAAQHRAQIRLPASPSSVAVARAVVANACRTWRVPQLTEHAALIVAELLYDAVQYTRTDLDVGAVLRRPYLYVHVHMNGGPGRPRLGGDALRVVDALAAGWGSTSVPGGRAVWAKLRLPNGVR